jgi:putative ATPase
LKEPELFSRREPEAPLAEAMRPRRLDDVLGQRHLIGEGKPLTLCVRSGKPHSLILWGPPGVGKTTIARLLAGAFEAEFIALSAVFSGVKEIREAVARAEECLQSQGRRTILFVDEVHRFNKGQQDAFLPFVERGLFTFIGATTENPSFEVNSALLSRASVYVLEPLKAEDLSLIIDRACETVLQGLAFTPEAREALISAADGDARRQLNFLDQVAQAAKASARSEVDLDFLSTLLSKALRRFDKGRDAFYDQISALHKSVRGSNPDAALYWFCRMLDGGADPRYVGRRIVRMASEEIGLADPRALRLALDACETYERLGSPEGELALAQACLYLACAPKSNAAYTAYNQGREFVSKDASRPVPVHLRNAPTRLMKQMGFGKEYRYAHDEPEGYAAGENYFPEGMTAPRFYQPKERGLEAKIGERLRYLRELDDQARKEKKP